MVAGRHAPPPSEAEFSTDVADDALIVLQALDVFSMHPATLLALPFPAEPVFSGSHEAVAVRRLFGAARTAVFSGPTFIAVARGVPPALAERRLAFSARADASLMFLVAGLGDVPQGAVRVCVARAVIELAVGDSRTAVESSSPYSRLGEVPCVAL